MELLQGRIKLSKLDLKLNRWWLGLSVIAGSFIVSSLVTILSAWLLFSNLEIAKLPKDQSVDFNLPSAAPTLTADAIKVISEKNIFDFENDGQVISPTKEEVNSGKLVKTSLPLKLQGTIYGGDPFSGIALIENSSVRTVNSFIVGDTLPKSKAVIVEILRERIIIDNAGRREYLEVERKELVRNRRNKKKPVKTNVGATKIAPIATNPPPANFKEEGFERKSGDIEMTEAYRSKLLGGDFTKVLQDAKATPNMVGGELRGFKLTKIREDSIYEKAGLQNDDVVEEINGVPLTGASQAIKLLQSLRAEKEIEIRVNRGGSVLTFNLNVR